MCTREQMAAAMGLAVNVGAQQPTKSNAQRQQEIEHSKFLGGDMEHTHLVKGLDFQLLNKVRNEMRDKSKVERESDAEGKVGQVTKDEGNNKKKQKQEDVVEFKTHAGKLIHDTLFGKGPTKSRAIEQFRPGRMAFEFDLDLEFPQELPTTITRSRADCPKFENSKHTRMPGTLVDRIERIMHFMRQCALGNKPAKRMKKKDKGRDEDEIADMLRKDCAR